MVSRRELCGMPVRTLMNFASTPGKTPKLMIPPMAINRPA